MRRIITFLGTHRIERTVAYTWGGHTLRGRVFGEALLQHPDLPFDEMLVLATPEAKRTTWPALAEHAETDERIRLVSIEAARDEAGLWGMFRTLTQCVEPGDTVLFDITHSLRYVPFVVFLSAAYLRTACAVEIEAITYGAFEMRGPEPDSPAPVIDLSLAIEFLDWLGAADSFVHTGNAQRLSALLKGAGASRETSTLKYLGEHLRRLSAAMMLCQPLEAMRLASDLPKRIDSARGALPGHADPFRLLLDRVGREYAARGVSEPDAHENADLAQSHQLELIRWYRDNGQLSQALLLAREWLVSAVGLRLGIGLGAGLEERLPVERAINRVSRRMSGRAEDEPKEDDGSPDHLANWPEIGQLIPTWDALTNMRNKLAHAGFGHDRTPAHRLIADAERTLWPAFDSLVAAWPPVS